MLGSAAVVAFVVTTDAGRARRFYGETLGLRLLQDDGFALVFDGGGATIRVVRMERHEPAAHTVLGWQVADVPAAARALVARGVVFERFDGMEQDADGVWTPPGGGAVAWFRDPDGNLLSLSGAG